ncbi:hypothetical protein Clacol_003458 [Clathrus columnatus]|uniref:Uncharacterized protein n=1 Tax=Clathrus columnatus TaxID=1419009 RepID=A0AAV5A889_9AGAM|nr:hypothetical protein Clacol_003458 [Clathrus columnatus]
MAMSQRLPKAIDAMKRVYGNFEKDITALTHYDFPPNPQGHKGRYLWTDAFGVCNFVSLYRITRDSRYLLLAERLVEVVHRILGSTRDGKRPLPRADAQHPLRGGLRIGKLKANGIDSDGQYYHYLVVWMFALNRLAKVTNKTVYNDLAIELAQVIHRKFVIHEPNLPPRIMWKMNADLTDALVSKEGSLDAVQGYLAYMLLREANRKDPNVLSKEIDDLKEIINNHPPLPNRHHKDPLDLGMGLWIAHYFADVQGEEWAKTMKTSYVNDADALFHLNSFDPEENPLDNRLPFREFGLAMGIACICPLVEENRTEHDKQENQIKQILDAWEDVILAHPKENANTSLIGLRRGDGDTENHIDLVMYASVVCPIEFQLRDSTKQTL